MTDGRVVVGPRGIRARVAGVLSTRGLGFNVLWTGASAGASQASLLLTNVLLARLLPDAEFADVLITLTLTALVPAAFTLGLERLGVVLLSNASGPSRRSLVGSMTRVSLLASAAAGVVAAALALAGVVSSGDWRVVAGVAAVVFAENARLVLADLPRAWNRADIAALAGPAMPRVLLLVLVVGLRYGAGVRMTAPLVLVLLALLTVATAALAAVAVRRLAASDPRGPGPTGDATEGDGGGSVGWGRVVRTGVPLSVGNVALVALNQLDVLVAAMYFRPSVVASYAVASRTANLIGNVRTMMNVALLPRLSQRPAGRSDQAEQVRLARGAMTGLFVVVLVPALVAVVWSEPVLAFLYGPGNTDAAVAMVWLVLGQLVNVGAGVAGTFLLRDGRQRLIMIVQVLCAVVLAPLLVVSAARGSVMWLALFSGLGTAACGVVMAGVVRRGSGDRTWIYGGVEIARQIAARRGRVR